MNQPRVQPRRRTAVLPDEQDDPMDAAAALPGRTLHGTYRVGAELGRGAMGVVFEARHQSLGKRVAIKMLAPAYARDRGLRKRFFEEAETLARFDHPNVIQVLDYFEEDEHLFLVMSYCPGQPLARLLEQGPLPEARARTILSGVLQGLDYVHRQSVFHRDVKPSNIIVGDDDRVTLIDFGIAVRADGTRMTRHGARVGTTLYMSPEQITRPDRVDHRTDVYSAGVVLYEMLAGRPPFDAESDFDIERMHVLSPPPRLRTKVSEPLRRAMLRALAKEPDDRFGGCAEFLEALQRPAPPPGLPWKRMAGAGLLAAAGWLAWEQVQDRSARQGPHATQAAYQLTLVGTRTLGIYCDRLVRLTGKQMNHELAQRVHDREMELAYAIQIEGLTRDLRRSSEDFVALGKELATYPASTRSAAWSRAQAQADADSAPRMRHARARLEAAGDTTPRYADCGS